MASPPKAEPNLTAELMKRIYKRRTGGGKGRGPQ
jgi:hypothetical protein